MSDAGNIQVSLNADDFLSFIHHYQEAYAGLGTTVEGIILSSDVCDLLTNSFFNGHQGLVKEIKHRTDRSGRIVMTIAGIRIYPTKSLDMFHPLFILDTGKAEGPNGANPVFPTTGPGKEPPPGGTPIALAA